MTHYSGFRTLLTNTFYTVINGAAVSSSEQNSTNYDYTHRQNPPPPLKNVSFNPKRKIMIPVLVDRQQQYVALDSEQPHMAGQQSASLSPAAGQILSHVDNENRTDYRACMKAAFWVSQ